MTHEDRFNPYYWLSDDELKRQTLAEQDPSSVGELTPDHPRQYAPEPAADVPRGTTTYLGYLSDLDELSDYDSDAELDHASTGAWEAHRATQGLNRRLWSIIRPYLAASAFGAFVGYVLWLFATEGP